MRFYREIRCKDKREVRRAAHAFHGAAFDGTVVCPWTKIEIRVNNHIFDKVACLLPCSTRIHPFLFFSLLIMSTEDFPTLDYHHILCLFLFPTTHMEHWNASSSFEGALVSRWSAHLPLTYVLSQMGDSQLVGKGSQSVRSNHLLQKTGSCL